MIELVAPLALGLTPSNRVFATTPVVVPQLTSLFQLTLQRPTTLAPLNWDATSTVRVSIIFLVGGIEYVTVGQASGGIRLRPDGTEGETYMLRVEPTILAGDKARRYLDTATKDGQGFYRNVPLSRLGETGASVQAFLRLEWLRGRIETVLRAEFDEAPAPILGRYKNSVAFDARTTATEDGGDGIISLSHTASGSDRAAFAGSHNALGTPVASTSTTYDGAGMTELWDAASGQVRNAGYILPNIPTGAKTVTNTLASAPWDHILGVISFTGAHQTTPNGNQQTGSGTGISSSLTCTGVSSDDMVVDAISVSVITSSLTVGADQNNTTQGWTLYGGFLGSASGGSTQAGASGGVMSWSWTGSNAYYHGAVVIEPAAGGDGSAALSGSAVTGGHGLSPPNFEIQL